MEWSIAQVARMSGVTARTLRHYDEIGLLAPAWVEAGGRRHYGQEQLLRLQQILLLRRLGLGLREIGRVLAEQVDELEALRAHQHRLLAERARLDALAATVAHTIAALEKARKENTMPEINRPENLFEGFDTARLEEEWRERWPELADDTERAAALLSSAEVERGQRERTALMIRMGEHLTAGMSADAPAVQAEVHAQYEAMARIRRISAEQWCSLADSCVQDEQWRAAYEEIIPGLADYQRDAMVAYAAAHLH